MNPNQAFAWISVASQLIILGKTTYDEVAQLFKASRGPTDADTAQADDEELDRLRNVITEARIRAAIEAGE